MSYPSRPTRSLIQLSDAHFGASHENARPPSHLLPDLAVVVRELHQPTVLVSGDITFKASKAGFAEAIRFFDDLRSATGLERSQFIFCPGNHDCDQKTHFEEFDAFTYAIRHDNQCTFSKKSCRKIEVGDLSFILVNSSFHLDHRYGKVDIPAFDNLIIDSPRDTIAVSHHHVIPYADSDISTTRNAYQFLSKLDKMRIPLLLHGHQHVSNGFPIGQTPTQIFGVNSFNFDSRGGINALNVFEWFGEHVRFTRRVYLPDGPGRARGRFQTADCWCLS